MEEPAQIGSRIQPGKVGARTGNQQKRSHKEKIQKPFAVGQHIGREHRQFEQQHLDIGQLHEHARGEGPVLGFRIVHSLVAQHLPGKPKDIGDADVLQVNHVVSHHFAQKVGEEHHQDKVNAEAGAQSSPHLPRFPAAVFQAAGQCIEVGGSWRVTYHNNRQEQRRQKVYGHCMISFSKSLDNAEENFDFELKDITVVARGKNDKVILKFKNGMESDFETLPAGYRRAFSIAFDIANRAFLLNSNCNPDGVVLIDEIDLHLHPSLAQEILERLQITFPRIQFIVSTHSPLVLSNFKQDETDNSVYRLTRNENFGTSIQKINYSFGIDYNTLLTDLMGTKFRNSLLRQLIESYYYWKESEDEEMMNSIYTEIVGLVGNNSNILTHLK